MTLRCRFDKATSLNVAAEEVYDWHLRPGALTRLSPPWLPVEVIGDAKPPAVGDRVTLKLGGAPLKPRWVASHTQIDEGRGFEDVQIEGPFKHWRHSHRFESKGEQTSELRDSIEYELPLGVLGKSIGEKFVRRSLERTFAYRHETTRMDLDFHHRYPTARRLRVAITGASGLIGSALTSFLTTGGHEVVPIVRQKVDEESLAAQWEPEVGIVDLRKLERLDAIVHLAGENISEGRWTEDKKRKILTSRVEGTGKLLRSIAKLAHPPKTVLSASAIGYYGNRGDEVLAEGVAAGEGFLADVCRQWEESAIQNSPSNSRVVTARFGVVMTPRGGALAKMLPPFKLGGGGNLGRGQQFISWIGIDDVVGGLTHLLLTPEISGPVNIVSPTPVRNSEFTSILARVLRRPAFVPMPGPLARIIFGQMAEEALLASTRVEPGRLLASNYRFRNPDLESALRRLLGR